MFAEQRRQQILQILDTHGSTTLTELIRLLRKRGLILSSPLI